MSLAYILAWILPWFAGTGICLALNRGMRAQGDIAAILGTGFLFGLFLVAGLASFIAQEDTRQAFSDTAPWLAGIGILAWAVALKLRNRKSLLLLEQGLSPALRVLWWALLAAIVLRLGVLGSEALLRPTFPWDAWSAWSVKPKAWFLIGHYVPYVSMQEWLANPDLPLRTAAIWDYPELLAWIEIWFASAAGGWNEPLINFAWTGVLASIGLASYGQWRAIGLRPEQCMLLVYGLVSLPLLGAHVALAGYADLWLAAALGMAVLGWLRWMHDRAPGQLVLAGLFAATLPMIKLEGAVWLAIFSSVVVLSMLPKRIRWWVVTAALLLALLGLALGGFAIPILGLGWVRASWGEVIVPALGALDLHWRPVGRAMLSGLLTLPNWHLLWYLLPLAVALRWHVFQESRMARSLGAMLGLCALFLFVLFFFTEASTWAENYTSANRLILHIVPAVFSLLALLIVGFSLSNRDTPEQSTAPTAEG
ncbi:hypothetical protein [Dokdonella sp.]|uniref:hypothetical protein n=1 Tax=Dokdonella sp. TaxID=2291710 RepID=UPI003529CBCF